MGPFSFFLRVLIITLVAILFMQIRIGDTTIERHALLFLQNSSLIAPIDETATNISRLVRNGLTRLSKMVSTNFNKAKYGAQQSASSWNFSFPVIDNTTKKKSSEGEDSYQDRKPAREKSKAAQSTKDSEVEIIPLKTEGRKANESREDTRSVLERFKDTAMQAKERLQQGWNSAVPESSHAKSADPESEDLIEDETY